MRNSSDHHEEKDQTNTSTNLSGPTWMIEWLQAFQLRLKVKRRRKPSMAQIAYEGALLLEEKEFGGKDGASLAREDADLLVRLRRLLEHGKLSKPSRTAISSILESAEQPRDE